MKKILTSIMFITIMNTAHAELNDLHFYAQKEHFNKIALEVALESNPEMLIELGKVSTRTEHAPIHIAIIDKNIDALKEIVKYQDYIDVKNSNEQTALMLALKNGKKDYIKLLIDNGASIDTRDKEGNHISAYAEVGGVNLKDYIDVESSSYSKEVIEDYKKETEEISSSFAVDAQKLVLMEQNINDLISKIQKNNTSIEAIATEKSNFSEMIKETTNEVTQLKNKLKKQASILLPIVKSNLNKIKTIDSQLLIIDEKTKDLKAKLNDLDALKNEMVSKLKALEDVEKDIEKTRESFNKTNLELELEKEARINSENNIKKEDIKMSSLIDDDEILQLEPINEIIEIEEENAFKKMIMDNYLLLILLASLLGVIAFIVLKTKNKKVEKTEIETIESKNTGEESQNKNILDDIEIDETKSEENVETDIEDDIFENNDFNEESDNNDGSDDLDSLFESSGDDESDVDLDELLKDDK